MARIKAIRKGNGEVFIGKKGDFVFVKEGVHFPLSKEEMLQFRDLIDGLLDSSLKQIDPTSSDMAKGD